MLLGIFFAGITYRRHSEMEHGWPCTSWCWLCTNTSTQVTMYWILYPKLNYLSMDITRGYVIHSNGTMCWCYAFGVSVNAVKHYLPNFCGTRYFLQLFLLLIHT